MQEGPSSRARAFAKDVGKQMWTLFDPVIFWCIIGSACVNSMSLASTQTPKLVFANLGLWSSRSFRFFRSGFLPLSVFLWKNYDLSFPQIFLMEALMSFVLAWFTEILTSDMDKWRWHFKVGESSDFCWNVGFHLLKGKCACEISRRNKGLLRYCHTTRRVMALTNMVQTLGEAWKS